MGEEGVGVGLGKKKQLGCSYTSPRFHVALQVTQRTR